MNSLSAASPTGPSTPRPPVDVRAWLPPPASSCLGAFVTAAGAPKLAHAITLPLNWLGGTSRAEFWSGLSPAHHSEGAGWRLGEADEVLLGSLIIDEREGPIEQLAERGYRLLAKLSLERGFPHLLRVWNYLGAINAGEHDQERYRRFCVGRARVIAREPPTGYAAATAIGLPGAPSALHLHWLAARRPGVPIENPRQVSAWDYPREYGPVAPGFSRAMLLEWGERPLLLISGTASVVGHATTHQDALAQLDETLRNLDALLARAGARVGSSVTHFSGSSCLRAYVRDPALAATVSARLIERLGANVPCMVLHGDVCRRDLLVEIEAVHPF
jgi:chorismate lyase/3-hydroxybenzoate synthase